MFLFESKSSPIDFEASAKRFQAHRKSAQSIFWLLFLFLVFSHLTIASRSCMTGSSSSTRSRFFSEKSNNSALLVKYGILMFSVTTTPSELSESDVCQIKKRFLLSSRYQ